MIHNLLMVPGRKSSELGYAINNIKTELHMILRPIILQDIQE